MRLAVMSYSYASAIEAGRLDTAGVIRHGHALGVDAFELMDRLIDESEVPGIRAALAATGSRVVCYDLAVDFAVPDLSQRRTAGDRVRRGLERAAALGASQVMIFAGASKPGLAADQARTWMAEGLRSSLAEAARLQLVPMTENLGIEAELCGTSEHLLDLRRRVGDDLRLTFDAGNFLLAGEDELAALERLRPFITHVHLKDWSLVTVAGSQAGVYAGIDGRHVRGEALGDGVVKLPGVIQALAQSSYRGYLAIEYEGTGDPLAAVERGVAYVRARVAMATGG